MQLPHRQKISRAANFEANDFEIFAYGANMYKENPPVVHKNNIYVLVYTFLEKALHYVYTAA